MIRIVIADGEGLFREGLRGLLEQEQDFKVVGEGAEAEEALTLARQHQPDVLLLEVELSGMEGVQFLRELKGQELRTAPVVISSCEREDRAAEMLAEGALGFVLKSSGRHELFMAIRMAAQGRPYVDPSAAGRLISSLSARKQENQLFEALSPREKVVLYWVAQGYSNEEVARKLVLSEKTVKNHVSHMLKKLELRDRTQAAVQAWKLGFARMDPELLEFPIEES